MELKTEDIKALEPVKFNYEELKKELTEKVENYKNLVYTEENINMAKKDRANLNKLKKAINDEKIRVKNTLLAPYTDFESKCKELIKIVDTSVENVDRQVKAFEDEEKRTKTEEIQKYFNEHVGIFKDIIVFENIFEDRWLNKTTAMKTVQADIEHIFSRATSDLTVIESTVPDKEIQKQCIAFYFKNITNPSILGTTIQKARELIEEQKKIEELKQAEGTEKTESGTKSTKNGTKNTENGTEKKFTIAFLAQEMVNEQMQALKKCLKDNNIKYGPVPGFEKSKKPLVLDYSESKDDYEDVRGQELHNEIEKIDFSVYNLADCPEDAIIGRDLFTADDYIDALCKGMELAKKGYTDIEINEIESEEE